jgi:hypothetical protein
MPPPSTADVPPVANADSSLARNAQTPSRSAVVPARAMGIRPMNAARTSASSLMAGTKPVSA